MTSKIYFYFCCHLKVSLELPFQTSFFYHFEKKMSKCLQSDFSESTKVHLSAKKKPFGLKNDEKFSFWKLKEITAYCIYFCLHFCLFISKVR